MGKCSHKRKVSKDSRPVIGGRRRRYECLDCGERFSTMEVPIENVKSGVNMIAQMEEQFGLNSEQIKAISLLVEAFSKETIKD